MKVSIITVSFNSETTIRDTINSVLSQDYSSLEYIIIDGLSKDRTTEIIKEYGNRIDIFKTEKDNGIYDAMNKGLKYATGDIVAFLNSDDYYSSEDIIKNIVRHIKNENKDILYGDVIYLDKIKSTKVKRYWRAGDYNYTKLKYGWMPPHPTFFVKKKLYEKYGGYNLNMGSAADYELMLRLLYRYKIPAIYLPEVIVKMRSGGVSNSSISGRLNANIMDKKAWRINGMKPLPFTHILKPLRKIPQFFIKP